jgi:hypothetical protein
MNWITVLGIILALAVIGFIFVMIKIVEELNHWL